MSSSRTWELWRPKNRKQLTLVLWDINRAAELKMLRVCIVLAWSLWQQDASPTENLQIPYQFWFWLVTRHCWAPGLFILCLCSGTQSGSASGWSLLTSVVRGSHCLGWVGDVLGLQQRCTGFIFWLESKLLIFHNFKWLDGIKKKIRINGCWPLWPPLKSHVCPKSSL